MKLIFQILMVKIIVGGKLVSQDLQEFTVSMSKQNMRFIQFFVIGIISLMGMRNTILKIMGIMLTILKTKKPVNQFG